MCEIGKTDDNPDAKGLAILIHPKVKDCVTDFKTYSNSVMKMKVNLQGKDSTVMLMHQHLVQRNEKRNNSG